MSVRISRLRSKKNNNRVNRNSPEPSAALWEMCLSNFPFSSLYHLHWGRVIYVNVHMLFSTEWQIKRGSTSDRSRAGLSLIRGFSLMNLKKGNLCSRTAKFGSIVADSDLDLTSLQLDTCRSVYLSWSENLSGPFNYYFMIFRVYFLGFR